MFITDVQMKKVVDEARELIKRCCDGCEEDIIDTALEVLPYHVERGDSVSIERKWKTKYPVWISSFINDWPVEMGYTESPDVDFFRDLDTRGQIEPWEDYSIPTKTVYPIGDNRYICVEFEEIPEHYREFKDVYEVKPKEVTKTYFEPV